MITNKYFMTKYDLYYFKDINYQNLIRRLLSFCYIRFIIIACFMFYFEISIIVSLSL